MYNFCFLLLNLYIKKKKNYFLFCQNALKPATSIADVALWHSFDRLKKAACSGHIACVKSKNILGSNSKTFFDH